MPKPQPKPSPVRRFCHWLARHKVATILLALFLAVALYFAISALVLNIQIHFERQKFIKTATELNVVANIISDPTPISRKDVSSCQYTSVELGQGSRVCNIDKYFIYAVNNSEAAVETKNVLQEKLSETFQIQIYKNPSQDPSNLATYNLSLDNTNIGCFIDYWYIQGSKLPFDLNNFSVSTAQGLLVQLNCGGPAKAEYFPVVKA